MFKFQGRNVMGKRFGLAVQDDPLLRAIQGQLGVAPLSWVRCGRWNALWAVQVQLDMPRVTRRPNGGQFQLTSALPRTL